MVSPDSKIERFRDDEVHPTEDRYLKKQPPSRDFREVAHQVDEKRYKEEETKRAEKKTANRKQVAREDRDSDEAPPSIFDLVKNTKNRSKDDDEGEKPKQESVDVIDEDPKLRKKDEPVQEKATSNSNFEFVPEQRDLSSVNPLANQATTAVNINPVSAKAPASTAPVQNIQEIIDRIAKEISVLEMNGKSETVITLKGPLFDQSRLILSEFDTAKGQFNITFDNLTQAAKNMLDLNQNTLIENLSKKGYMVHIVTTTTVLEPTRIDQSQLSQEDSNRQNDQGNPDDEKERDEKSR